MPYTIYFISFDGDYSFSLQDALSRRFQKMHFHPVIAHKEDGFLVLLPKEEKNDAQEYLEMMKEVFQEKGIVLSDKELKIHEEAYLKHHETSFELLEIEEALQELGLSQQYKVEKMSAQMEYVFWVTKDHHSDILLRSTKVNLLQAYQELPSVITNEHRYYDYELTRIDLHYKTEKGYIGKRETYPLRKGLPLHALAKDGNVDLLTYL